MGVWEMELISRPCLPRPLPRLIADLIKSSFVRASAPIDAAAKIANWEIVEILAPFTDNPNALGRY